MKARPASKVNLFAAICAVVFFLAFLFLFIREDYPHRILSRLNPKKVQTAVTFPYDDRTLSGWDRCLEQMNVHADIAFLGDSITYLSDFSQAFPDKTICNLGIAGDTIQKILDRVSMVKNVHADQIFLLCGINSLNNNSLEKSIAEYEILVSVLLSQNSGDLHLISVLPISQAQSKAISVSTETITSFNQSIRELASSKGIAYIDLYSLLEQNGFIKPEYTTDGIHLTDSAYAVWRDTIRPYID